VIVYGQSFGTDTLSRPHFVTSGFTETGALPASAGFDFLPKPGLPLRASRTTAITAGPTGPYKISVVGSALFGTNNYYSGPYRMAVVKISGATESVSPVLTPGALIIESGDPSGEIDHFILKGTPGQQVAVYSSSVPLPDGTPSGTASFAFWNDGRPILGVQNDSLGLWGTGLVTLGTLPVTIDVEAAGILGRPFQYRLWVYTPNRSPEQVPASVRIGDVVSGESLYPSADIDEFTLTAAPGARYQACILNKQPDQPTERIQLLVVSAGVGTGFINSPGNATAPTCTNQTFPNSGTVVLRVLDVGPYGGRYELSILALP
jgi:hypothetical protein